MFDAIPTVFVVDDDVSVRESLKLLIESFFRISMVASCRTWLPIGSTCP